MVKNSYLERIGVVSSSSFLVCFQVLFNTVGYVRGHM